MKKTLLIKWGNHSKNMSISAPRCDRSPRLAGSCVIGQFPTRDDLSHKSSSKRSESIRTSRHMRYFLPWASFGLIWRTSWWEDQQTSLVLVRPCTICTLNEEIFHCYYTEKKYFLFVSFKTANYINGHWPFDQPAISCLTNLTKLWVNERIHLSIMFVEEPRSAARYSNVTLSSFSNLTIKTRILYGSRKKARVTPPSQMANLSWVKAVCD